MRKFRIAICVCAATLSTSAFAQVTMEAPPAPPVAPLAPTQAYLRVGTEVVLRLSEELTTKNKALKVGQRFRMETTEAVLVQGVVVVPVGSPAVGEITEVRNKGMWGRSGHFTAQIRYLTVNGRQIRLSGTFDDKGTAGGVGAAAVSGIVFLPAGFFMTGTSAKLPLGTPVKGFVDEDVPLILASAAPPPLVVGAAVPPEPAVAAAPSTPAATPAPEVSPAPATEPAKPTPQIL